MKLKVFWIVFFVFSLSCIGQNLISKDVNDTISIEKIGKKIELENDLDKCKQLNDQIIATCKIRKELKYIHPKIKKYYQYSYLTCLLTDAFLEDEKGNTQKSITIQIYLLNLLEKDKNKNKKLLGYVYRSISAAFAKQEEFEKGKQYSLKAIPFALQDRDKSNLSNLYVNLGFFYRELKDNKNGELFYIKGLTISVKIKDTSSIANCLHNLSSIYIDNKEYKKAFSLAKQAVNLSKKTNDLAQLSQNYLNLHELEQISKNSEGAFNYLKLAYNASKKSKKLKTLLITTNLLYKYYKEKNQSYLALKFLEEYITTNNVIDKEENKNAILKAEFKYETEKKEAQIKNLSQQKKIAALENKRQKTTLFLLVFGIFSALITAFLLFKRYKANKQNELLKSEIDKTQAQNKATESELKALKSQMNPHFIFNALNSIQEQFMFGDKLVANEQMGNFTTLTRQILSVSGKIKIPLSIEIDILTKYLELEKMRFDTDFEYHINNDDNIDDEYIELPPMLIQPFVENSIKHGLMHKTGFKILTLNFNLSLDKHFLICTIIDNGIGREESLKVKQRSLIKHDSFSTKATDERLKLLNDKSQNDSSIIYEDILNANNQIEGTKVIISIQIE